MSVREPTLLPITVRASPAALSNGVAGAREG